MSVRSHGWVASREHTDDCPEANFTPYALLAWSDARFDKRTMTIYANDDVEVIGR